MQGVNEPLQGAPALRSGDHNSPRSACARRRQWNHDRAHAALPAGLPAHPGARATRFGTRFARLPPPCAALVASLRSLLGPCGAGLLPASSSHRGARQDSAARPARATRINTKPYTAWPCSAAPSHPGAAKPNPASAQSPRAGYAGLPRRGDDGAALAFAAPTPRAES